MSSMLTNQLEELKQRGNMLSNEKMEQLENKKGEIMRELARVKEEHQKLENAIENNTKSAQHLDNKKKELMKLIEHYDYKIFTEEYNMSINSSELVVVENTNSIYRYNLPYRLENVMQIMLLDQNFNNNMYNITPYNNMLILEELEEANQIENEENTLMEYNYKDGRLEIKVDAGKYELDILVVSLNPILRRYNVEIGYDPIKYIVQLKSLNNKPFKLIKVVNDIFTVLGFSEEEMNKSNNKHRGKRMADMRVCKQININIGNINNNLLSKVNVANSKTISNLMVIKPYLKTLNYIDFIFTGENGRPYWFNLEDGETFNFIISIKGKIIEEEKNKYINQITVDN
jgi:hypothetical protein